jgi:hypothetical protein
MKIKMDGETQLKFFKTLKLQLKPILESVWECGSGYFL